MAILCLARFEKNIISSNLKILNFKYLIKFLLNRNVILVLAVILGFTFDNLAFHLKNFVVLLLALVMTFSMAGIETHSFLPLKNSLKPLLMGIILNYLVFGFLLIGLTYLLTSNTDYINGFIIIAAAPPGVAIIPFTNILKGNTEYSIIGVMGAFLASIFIAPLLISLFSGHSTIDPLSLFYFMVKLIIIPFFLSRLLLIKKIRKTAVRLKGRIVDIGFAVIIYTVVGLNKNILLQSELNLIKIILILFLSIFIFGTLYEFIARSIKIPRDKVISQTLLVTIKSSGFSAVSALALFNEQAAIPSALLAIFVLLYLLFLSFREELNLL